MILTDGVIGNTPDLESGIASSSLALSALICSSQPLVLVAVCLPL